MCAGANTLKSYPHDMYSAALSVAECDAFLMACIQHGRECSSMADSVRAVLPLLHHLHQTSLPDPAVSTFALSAECISAQLEEGLPANQVLVQLQQQVWGSMHSTVGAESGVITAYLPAFDVLQGTEAVQTMLLMARNGLKGLTGDCCLALVLVLEDHHHAWLHEQVGAAFANELEVLADRSSQGTSQAGSAWLDFPDKSLPRLQLNAEGAYFELHDGDTPWWMVPMTAWQHMQAPRKPSAEQTSMKGNHLSDAEQLIADYGHLENGSKSKRKKHN